MKDPFALGILTGIPVVVFCYLLAGAVAGFW